jgi:Uma2 family endonuclease
MSLDQFDDAIARPGYLYELNKGVIEVSNVPEPGHELQIQEVRDQLGAYRSANPSVIYLIASPSGAKLLIESVQSERHPDLFVYLSPPPSRDKGVWSVWVPAIVVEVVSPSSAKRDYKEKPPEYFEFGVDEYWIIDQMKGIMTVLYRWRGKWKPRVIKPSQKYSTHLLPGFSLDLKRVFAAAK